MHLVYKALEKYAIPSVLPPELMPPGKRKPAPPIVGKAPAAQIPVMAAPIPTMPTQVPTMTAPPPIPPLPSATSAVNSLVGLEPVKVRSRHPNIFLLHFR